MTQELDQSLRFWRNRFSERFPSMEDERGVSWDAFCFSLFRKVGLDPNDRTRSYETDAVEFWLREANPSNCKMTVGARLERDTDEARCNGRPTHVLEVKVDFANDSSFQERFEILDSVWNGGRLPLCNGNPKFCAKHLPRLALRGVSPGDRGEILVRCTYVWCCKPICESIQSGGNLRSG